MDSKVLNFIENKKLYFTLKENFLNSTLPQSSIISGEKGIGKSTLIKYFALQIFENYSNDENKLSESNHSILISNKSHPNFILISKEINEKSKKLKNYITINQIRNIESFIYQTSIFDLPKIVLIDSADELNVNASNSLLKILEEPKKNTFFFLISHQPSCLIPTIHSRCIRFKLDKPSFEEFKKILILNNNEIINSEIELLYDLSFGSPGLALDLISEDIVYIFNNIVDICKNKKKMSKEILELSKIVSNKNNKFRSFLSIFRFVLSNAVKNNLGIVIENKFSSNISKKLYDLSGNLNTKYCIKALNYLNNHEMDLFNLNLDKKIFTINLFSELTN